MCQQAKLSQWRSEDEVESITFKENLSLKCKTRFRKAIAEKLRIQSNSLSSLVKSNEALNVQ